jgi:hypothetical protein
LGQLKELRAFEPAMIGPMCFAALGQCKWPKLERLRCMFPTPRGMRPMCSEQQLVELRTAVLSFSSSLTSLTLVCLRDPAAVSALLVGALLPSLPLLRVFRLEQFAFTSAVLPPLGVLLSPLKQLVQLLLIGCGEEVNTEDLPRHLAENNKQLQQICMINSGTVTEQQREQMQPPSRMLPCLTSFTVRRVGL